jgi:methionyl-tRNA formyltransferase
LRIVFFGTPEIAGPTLEALIAGPHDVVGVVTQPDRRRGRGKKFSPSPIAEIALRDAIPLLRPERVGDEEAVATLREWAPDLGVVVAFGQFLPKKVRELPSCGYLINAHASLLPKYRGASPIAHAILAGEKETGISVMRIEREMDAGPVALVRKTPIRAHENTAELSTRLAALAALAIGEAVDQIASSTIEWTEQDAAQASEAPKFEKADAQLDFREPAEHLVHRIHALAPKPGASALLVAAGREESLKILQADSANGSEAGHEPGETPPGTLAFEPLRIATGRGWLLPRLVQRAGSKAMPIDDFLRGFPLAENARFRCPANGDETREEAKR